MLPTDDGDGGFRGVRGVGQAHDGDPIHHRLFHGKVGGLHRVRLSHGIIYPHDTLRGKTAAHEGAGQRARRNCGGRHGSARKPAEIAGLGARRDSEDITPAMMSEFKVVVSKVLTPHASAILLDPEFGLEAAQARSKNAGLLLAYELSGYDNTQPGRLPDLLPHVSVKRIVDWGADAVKILIYYTPYEDAADQRYQARLHRAHRRGVRDLRDSVLPGIRGLRSEGRRREGPRIRQGQAGDRQAEHAGVFASRSTKWTC